MQRLVACLADPLHAFNKTAASGFDSASYTLSVVGITVWTQRGLRPAHRELR